MNNLTNEINRRRTFAIISHPDAGKTTITEKLLLYGGAINTAGSVKGKHNSKHATSDWMEIEKKRGISVTSSVLQFEYNNYCINILDTPGHQDFSEDTYRTLMAADSALMVIDAKKGVEAQTKKLFKVCVERHIPIFTFINKLDMDARDTFDLLDEIENVLGIKTYPINLPIGMGKDFKGIYDRTTEEIHTFTPNPGGMKQVDDVHFNINDERSSTLGTQLDELNDLIEMLDIAGDEFDIQKVHNGTLSPVFFGSALNNFGVKNLLEHFLKMSTSPLSRNSDIGEISPTEEFFSAFVFKIQANMNKAHRDRIAFMRICSGKYEAEMEVTHVQGNKKLRLQRPQKILAEDRSIVDEAYAGDIIGIFDPGIYSIGDTITSRKQPFKFNSIPTFPAEHFARVRQMDTMKRKQFTKGIWQIALEGAIQVYREINFGMEEIIVGVVGTLQFDVLKYRLESEYNVEIKLEILPYKLARFIRNESNPDKINKITDMKLLEDVKQNLVVLFSNEWNVKTFTDRNENLELTDTLNN